MADWERTDQSYLDLQDELSADEGEAPIQALQRLSDPIRFLFVIMVALLLYIVLTSGKWENYLVGLILFVLAVFVYARSRPKPHGILSPTAARVAAAAQLHQWHTADLFGHTILEPGHTRIDGHGQLETYNGSPWFYSARAERFSSVWRTWETVKVAVHATTGALIGYADARFGVKGDEKPHIRTIPPRELTYEKLRREHLKLTKAGGEEQ